MCYMQEQMNNRDELWSKRIEAAPDQEESAQHSLQRQLKAEIAAIASIMGAYGNNLSEERYWQLVKRLRQLSAV